MQVSLDNSLQPWALLRRVSILARYFQCTPKPSICSYLAEPQFNNFSQEGKTIILQGVNAPSVAVTRASCAIGVSNALRGASKRVLCNPGRTAAKLTKNEAIVTAWGKSYHADLFRHLSHCTRPAAALRSHDHTL